jgi:predicted nuclease of restriction endonuclease-like (RecB) superfamily
MDEKVGAMLINHHEYRALVEEVRERLIQARHRAMAAANQELVMLYWGIGQLFAQHQEWGKAFIPNLSRDIREGNPGLKGFSRRNLASMQKLAETYPDPEFLQTLSAKLSWSHLLLLVEKVQDPNERRWYTTQVSEQHWTVRRLESAIYDQTYQRQALADKASNFSDRLPEEQADQARDVMKDPYLFDFIDYRQGMAEREIEDELVRNVAKLLLELGTGFAFVGEQYHLEIAGRDFYIDLLFYHTGLHCYVVVELKKGIFKPEYAGQLNFYVSAIDGELKNEQDRPTIGLLLCQERGGLVAEYAFKDITKPIGVSEYRLVRELPADLVGLLPSTDDIAVRIGLEEVDDEFH